MSLSTEVFLILRHHYSPVKSFPSVKNLSGLIYISFTVDKKINIHDKRFNRKKSILKKIPNPFFTDFTLKLVFLKPVATPFNNNA